MDKNIIIRKATNKDIDFIIETIIEAEKGGSNNCGLANFFGLTIEQVCIYLRKMLEEEIDGCEFSIDSFYLLELNGKTVAAQSGWIEGENSNGQQSSILKSNLISYFLPKENIQHAARLADVIKGIQIPRTPNTLQLEYGYCKKEYRGNGYLKLLLEYFLSNTTAKAVETQIFSKNKAAISSFEKIGFSIVQEYRSDDIQTSLLFPHNKKVLMNKNIE